jgi:preprotein translocase subunit SecG
MEKTFWILSGLIFLVALALWYYDSYHRSLEEPFEDPFYR